MTKKEKENLQKFLRNVLKFTAPMFAVFFIQLQQGVDMRQAGLVALVALWGLLADYFKKIA